MMFLTIYLLDTFLKNFFDTSQKLLANDNVIATNVSFNKHFDKSVLSYIFSNSSKIPKLFSLDFKVQLCTKNISDT